LIYAVDCGPAPLVDLAAPLPLWTADLPGTGGVVKSEPEDFVVEEIAAYEPSGAGEHLYLWIEKRDVAADELVRHLSRALDVSQADVGVAGMKDKRAVTRQWVSVPARASERLAAVDDGVRLRVLRSALHDNKLRTGHLRGNRFSLVLRGVAADAVARARAVLERLAGSGVPNYYGEQRFGRGGETLDLGLRVLRGTAPRLNRSLFRLSLSSVQSALFNAYVAGRMRDGLLDRVIEGDVMQVVASGGPFWLEDLAREQARYLAREIVPTGPMYGPKMRRPRGAALARETSLLADAGLSIEAFAKFGKLTVGTRRAVVVWPEEARAESDPLGLRLSFTLPAGSYATVLLSEITKG
jgi:tRNA pseudouridine13 synthase